MEPSTDVLHDESNESDRSVIDSPAALCSAFVKHREHLCNMIRLRMNPKIAARVDASDIVQEVFVRANRELSISSLKPQIAPLVWLRQIAKHLIAETHRKNFRQKRNPNVEMKVDRFDLDLLTSSIAGSLESCGTKMAKQETIQRIRELLKEMPEFDREILELKHVDGLTFRNIADAMELNLDTVKKRYYRALERFKCLTTSLEL